jgi:hypothetical protein
MYRRVAPSLVLALALAGLTLTATAELIDPIFFTTANAIGSPALEKSFLQNTPTLTLQIGGTAFNPAYQSSLTYLAQNPGQSGAVSITNFTVVKTGPSNNPNTTASVSWNLTNTNFGLSYVLIKDGQRGDNGPYLYALYSVTADEAKVGVNQSVQVTPNADKAISHITFFAAVPEPSTWALLLIGSAATLFVRFRRR